MKVLIACEFSGIVRAAFEKMGHDAWSCDLLPTEIPGKHYQGDVFELLSYDSKWDLVVAHPPCTRLANSGVRWLAERNLWEEMEKAAYFFHAFLTLKYTHHIKRVCVENPIPHKYAMEIIKRGYDQIIQPWQFGHGETKSTCLWLMGLPLLVPTNIVNGREARVHKETGWQPADERRKNRSRTFPGIAQAMAEQWGKL